MIRRALLSIALLAGLACAEDYSVLMSPTFPDAAATAAELASSAWATDSAKKVAAASLDAIHIGAGQQAPTWDSAIAIVRARNRASVIFVDTSVLTSVGGTLPAVPITVYSQVGATLTTSGTVTVVASYRASELNIVGNVVYAGASTDRYYVTGGSRVGNVTLTSGLLHDDGTSLLGGTVTINGGSCEIISTTITSQIIHNAGALMMQNFLVNATKSGTMLVSNATSLSSAIQLVNGSITNLGTGKALDISANTQVMQAANGFANVIFKTSTHPVVATGSATYIVADCDTSLVTDVASGANGGNWGFLGNRTISTGSSITGYGTATIAPFYAYNTSTGRGFFASNASIGSGFVANNTSTGRGFSANNTSAGQGFFASNTSTGWGFVADNASTGSGFVANNTSTGRGFYASNASTGQGLFANNTSTGSGVAARFENAGSGISLSVQGSTVFDPAINSGSVTLYKYSNNKQAFSGSGTVTIDVGAIGAYCDFELLTRNVALTLTTSGGAAVIFKGGVAAASVSLPATQSSWEIKTDGTYVYIQ